MKYLLLLIFVFSFLAAYCQQDIGFHVNAHLLSGKNILKVKRDFNDAYLWVLAQNNEVYRINSITNTIDDYTPAFSSFTAQQFIDIAGRSQDTVFIATNSSNVIEYKKGVIKVISAADGLVTPVNSLGIAKVQTYYHDTHSLWIGSDKGIYTYDMLHESLTAYNDSRSSQVYEATYRDLIYKDSASTYADWNHRKYVPVTIKGEFTVFKYFMAENDTIGYKINTAYQAWASMYDYDMLDEYTALFWGTRNGMFQVNGGESYYMDRPYAQYLSGINVNKITTIFGLTAFGNGHWYGIRGLIKQNMLIATDNGLYYSNSIYQNYSNQLPGTRQVDLFHFDPLGNQVVNDVCVNTVSATEPVCDDGVWVAAHTGLYYLKPDYGAYLTTTSINAIKFNGQDEANSETQICSGSSINASINAAAYAGHTIQWYKDGVELSSQSNSTLLISEAGNYSAVVYDPCQNIHFNTNNLKVSVITTPAAKLNYPDINYFCDGTIATFEVNANPNYQYRWYKDGVLNNTTTNTIKVSQNGRYKVEVSACSGTWITSKEIEANFIKLPVAVIKTNKATYCIGENAQLSVNISTDPTYTINWMRDGTLLNGSKNETSITTDLPGSYSVNISSNIITCIQSSAAVLVQFAPLPSISIEKAINTYLCDGQTVDLKATYTSGKVQWSTGETNDLIHINKSGTYRASVISAAGCENTATINIQFFSNPVLNLQDAFLCQFTNQEVTLTAPPGFKKYIWNGKEGGASFTTASLGKVQLSVTDNNNCTASQTINISSYCADIKMGNTFSPNGDGVNDTWTIAGLSSDNSVFVKVYNRLGNQVFNSKGYSVPWDGTFNGKRLPAGTYYYIINTKAGTQILSGAVTIIY